MKRCVGLILLLPLASCSGEADTAEMGDMPKLDAIDTCVAVVQKQGAGSIAESAAIKADRYWEINGTTDSGGTIRCVINAVNEDVVISSVGS